MDITVFRLIFCIFQMYLIFSNKKISLLFILIRKVISTTEIPEVITLPYLIWKIMLITCLDTRNYTLNCIVNNIIRTFELYISEATQASKQLHSLT